VTVKVAAVVELQDTVAVPEPVTLPGVIAPQDSPAGTVSVSVTMLANPLTAVTVIVETADEPAFVAAGLEAAIVKSTKLNVAVVEWVRAGVVLVPVMVTVKVPAVVELQDTVAVPDPVTLPGVIAPHVNPAGTVSVRETTPAKPPVAVTVIVEVAEAPALTAAGDVAVMLKSWPAKLKVKVALAVWTSALLVPVMVTVKLAWVDALHDRVAVPDPVTVPGVIAPQVSPAGTVSVSVTMPANPFNAVMVIVEVAEVLTATAAGDVAAIVKSWKLKVAVAVCTNAPLVPVTVKV
jgi:hypothetical protein